MTEKIDFAIDYGETKDSCIIKVIGVGGGGSNAVRHMYDEGIIGVDFLVCNTDKGHLNNMPIPNKLVLGETGLGAGANPDVARKLALESKEKIKKFIGEDTRMLFITAGMGKGTGTGASPVIAEIAKSMDILTIGVVTYPFRFEGHKSAAYADAGIKALAEHVDSLIIVKNQNIMKFYNNEDIDTAFKYADDVLKNAVKCVAELITVNYEHNIDFNDIKTIMKDSGKALLGVAEANGDNRVEKVVEDALSCPLLDNTSYSDAKNFLFFISYGEESKLKMSELDALTEKFELLESQNAQVIFGRGLDTTLGDSIKLSVIITNFKEEAKPKNVILQNGAEHGNDVNDGNDAGIMLTTQHMSDRILDEGNDIFGNKSVDIPDMAAARPASDKVMDDDGGDIFGNKSVDIPAGMTPAHLRMPDDFAGLSHEVRQEQTRQPGAVYQFDGDKVIAQDSGTPFEASDDGKAGMPDDPLLNAPATDGPDPYNDMPAAMPTQIGNPRNMPDDEFQTMISEPAIVRSRMSKVAHPVQTVAMEQTVSMYEVDDDAHDFFKDLPD